jgi:hypothetical protein
MIEAVSTSETVDFYQTTRRNNLEDSLFTLRNWNLKKHVYLKLTCVGCNESNELNCTRFLTQSAARPDSGEAPYEILAPQPKQAVEVVISWDVDLQTIGVLKMGRPVTTLLRFVPV